MTTLTLISTVNYVDQLLSDADALKYERPEQVMQLAAEIIDLSQQMGDFRRFADGLIHQARANMQLTHYESALTSAMEALVLARQHGLAETEANAVGTLGVTLGACGLHDEARLLLEHKLRLAEQQRNREFQAMALNEIAFLGMGTARTRGASVMLERALAIVPPDSHRGLDRAAILHNLAQAWSADGRYQDAVSAGMEGLRAAEQVNCAPMMTSIHLGLAATHLVAEALELSVMHLDQARMHIDHDSFTPNHIKIELAMGNFLAAQGLYSDALEVLERAYDLSIQNQMIDMAVYSLHVIKEMHERLDDLLGVVVAYRRLTEDIVQQQQHYANLRLRVLAMVFAQDKAAAQVDLQMAQQKQAVFHGLSSEFSTPLAVIQMSAQLVENQAEKMPLEQRRKHLQLITAQVREMTSTLESVSRLMDGSDPAFPALPSRRFSVGTLVYLTMGRLEESGADVSRVEVTVSADDSRLRIEADLFEPVLWHLLGNALKFSTGAVHLDIHLDSGRLFVRVRDYGIGVPASELARVFLPMVRASNNEGIGGAGLGLAVVSKLVAQMHGAVDLVSSEGEGTTVTVRLPV